MSRYHSYDPGRGEIVLGAEPYKVQYVDQMLVFTHEFTLGGPVESFTLQKPRDINDSPGIWYLYSFEPSTRRGIAISALEAAFEFAKDKFGENFTDPKSV